MNEDEAFIRVIVDSPGDEAPRLVYADWLEERGDPRATYLRAEYEAVRTGDTSEIWRLAASLDPVWVARVTMPPLGACCEHVQVRDRGPTIDAQDIEQFERRCGITLPHDYRAFLLNYNGGVVGEAQWQTPAGESIDWYCEHVFYSLKHQSEMRNLECWIAFRQQYLSRYQNEDRLDPAIDDWFMQFIQVGRSPDEIFGVLLGVAEPVFGQVRYFDYSAGFHPDFFSYLGKPYASSFADLLLALPSTGYP